MPRIYTSIDITGKTFGRLTAIKFSHRYNNRDHHWEFLCSCGVTKVINKNKVVQGRTNSCGCLAKDVASELSFIHGHAKTRRKSPSRTYDIWSSMIGRVKRPRTISYVGLTVCDEWKDFTKFLRDMGEVPEGKSIDRIDNTKGYCKDNCRYATQQEQCRNTRGCLSRKTSSKYKGVVLLNKTGTWKATIRTGEKRLELGVFKTELEAGLAYNEAAKKYHVEFACLNPI